MLLKKKQKTLQHEQLANQRGEVRYPHKSISQKSQLLQLWLCLNIFQSAYKVVAQ